MYSGHKTTSAICCDKHSVIDYTMGLGLELWGCAAGISCPPYYKQVEEQTPKPVNSTMCFLQMILVLVRKLSLYWFTYIVLWMYFTTLKWVLSKIHLPTRSWYDIHWFLLIVKSNIGHLYHTSACLKRSLRCRYPVYNCSTMQMNYWFPTSTVLQIPILNAPHKLVAKKLLHLVMYQKDYCPILCNQCWCHPELWKLMYGLLEQ